MSTHYIRRVGQLVVLTIALLMVLTFGFTHTPLGYLAAMSAAIVASSNAIGVADTGSGPPVANGIGRKEQKTSSNATRDGIIRRIRDRAIERPPVTSG